MRGQLRNSALAVLSIAVLAAGSVGAQEAGTTASVDIAQAAAQAASTVADAHCADVAAGQATQFAEALAEVTPALRDVSQAFDATKKVYLLYWRGLLSACVGQEERAIQDLQAFVAGVDDRPSFAAQVEDAQRRLQRLGGVQTVQGPPRNAGGFVAGVALVGAGGALGGLSGWQGQLAQDGQAEFNAGARDWAETDAIGQEAESNANASNALLGAGIGSGVAGAVVLAVAAATGKVVATTAVLVPLPEGGLALRIGGRW
mgnify:CR=1 FL=1